jgi:glycosyltransferase involved in cell wall biosynthesis
VFYFPVTWPRAYVRAPRLGRGLEHRVKAFDLVHIHGLYLYPTMAAARACRRKGVPYVISPRGMLDPNAIRLRSTWKKRLYLWLIEKRNLRGATALHFTSSEEQRLVTQSGWQLPGFVVPNALDLADFPEPSAEADDLADGSNGEESVLFLSRIHPKKGLDLLVPAFAQVVANRPGVNLHVAGPDENGYLAQVQAWVASFDLKDRVTYPGMLLGREKIRAFQQSDLFVLPSYSENFGIAVIEAMACGKPVVITDRVNICRDVEQAGAGLVTRCDSNEIAQAILTLLADPARAREMGRRGRKLVEEKFTWERAAARMLRMYHRILDGRLDPEGAAI